MSREANLDLRGEVAYDWETLSRVLRPYVGDDAQIEGRETRQFAVRGPIKKLMETPTATAGSGANVDTFHWVKPLTAQAGVGWDRAQMFGLAIDRGEITTDLADGLLRHQADRTGGERGARAARAVGAIDAGAGDAHAAARTRD